MPRSDIFMSSYLHVFISSYFRFSTATATAIVIIILDKNGERYTSVRFTISYLLQWNHVMPDGHLTFPSLEVENRDCHNVQSRLVNIRVD